MRSCNHALGEKMAGRFGWAVREWFKYKNKLGDRMIKQLSNSVIAKYCDLSMSRRSIICLSLRLRQIIDLLATDKSQYFAQPRPIIVNYFFIARQNVSENLQPSRTALRLVHRALPVPVVPMFLANHASEFCWIVIWNSENPAVIIILASSGHGHSFGFTLVCSAANDRVRAYIFSYSALCICFA